MNGSTQEPFVLAVNKLSRYPKVLTVLVMNFLEILLVSVGFASSVSSPTFSPILMAVWGRLRRPSVAAFGEGHDSGPRSCGCSRRGRTELHCHRPEGAIPGGLQALVPATGDHASIRRCGQARQHRGDRAHRLARRCLRGSWRGSLIDRTALFRAAQLA